MQAIPQHFHTTLNNNTFDKARSNPAVWGRVVYWRERNDEVDFIIEKKGKVIALEVKTNVSGSTSGMAAFQKQFKPSKILMIGKSGLPWQEFLERNPGTLF